ncbi:hypothetical protein [Halorhodospira halophila]|nr:hypothetical protein [Halorhodospira halophila]
MLDDVITRREVVVAAASAVAVAAVLIGVGLAVGVYWCPLG